MNALTGQRALARASGQPGRTRQLNFFDLGGRLTLVDMPGYGYAQAPKEVKADWQGLMFDYLRGRPTPAARAAAAGRADRGEGGGPGGDGAAGPAAVTFQLVLTKADGVKPAPLWPRSRRRRRGSPASTRPPIPVLVTTSSETGLGIPELRRRHSPALRLLDRAARAGIATRARSPESAGRRSVHDRRQTGVRRRSSKPPPSRRASSRTRCRSCAAMPGRRSS